MKTKLEKSKKVEVVEDEEDDVPVLVEEVKHYHKLRELDALTKRYGWLAQRPNPQRHKRKLYELKEKIKTVREEAISLKEDINKRRDLQDNKRDDVEVKELESDLGEIEIAKVEE